MDLYLIRHDIRMFFLEKLPLKIAFLMPARIAYWCFIRVHSITGEAPGADFDKASKLFCQIHGIRP